MTSSLRTRSLAATLEHARRMAAELGITRVTDTTWLDYVGIPVFASIRPTAMAGSLCVNAGKGLRREEARVGAYMEAIEFALAEPGRSAVEVFVSTPREVVDQRDASFDFVDLCPIVGRPVDPDGPLACVMADELGTGRPVALPAELVFSPFPGNRGQRIFGCSTNGLSSGNTVAEATVHGLAEVIERDVQSFNFFDDASLFVDFDVAVPDVDELMCKIEKAGLQAIVRYTPSVFGLPYVQGFVLEPSDEAPIAVSHGAGLHLVKEIAAVRGLAEAAQSRLSYIHGGRDDLIERFKYFAGRDRVLEARAIADLRVRVCDSTGAVRWSEIVDMADRAGSIDASLRGLLDTLAANGIGQAFRVVLSDPGSSLAVVKVIVPGLEAFEPSLKRAGPRLVRAQQNGGIAP